MPVLTTVCAVFLLVMAVISKTWWQVGVYAVLLGYCVYWVNRERREAVERRHRRDNPELSRGAGTEAAGEPPAPPETPR